MMKNIYLDQLSMTQPPVHTWSSLYYWIALCYLLLITNAAATVPTFIALTSGDYAPFSGEQLAQGGVLSEVVTQAFIKSNIHIHITWQPWGRGYQSTKDGLYAGTYPYVRTAEREKDFLYSSPLLEQEQRAFFRVDKHYDFNDIEKLEHTRICMPDGWAPPAKIESMIKNGQIKRESPNSLNGCLKMILAGRADYFISNTRVGNALIQSAKLTSTTPRMSSTVLSTVTLHFIISRTLPQADSLMKKFDFGLQQIKKSGEYRKITQALDNG
ncbi:transporter substrate-binding domain-containing protein [Neisseriaceae bacterium TC5R-5]|nr:transporter substrate-binding domain-containing protein [Neisseriaceae bacterium TC5R-5]